MTIDWWTLGIQTVNVAVLVWLLQRFFWRPVAAMIEQRRAAAQQQLAEARGQARRRRPPRSPRSSGRAPASPQEREAILAAAHEAGRSDARAALLAEAAQQAAALRGGREGGDREGAGRGRARPGPSGRAGSRSTSPSAWPRAWTARRCAPRSSTGCSQEIRRLPEPARQAVAANGVALEAVSATPLDPAEQARYRELIGEAFGGPSADRLHGRSQPDRRPGTARPASRRAATVGAPISPESSRTSAHDD